MTTLKQKFASAGIVGTPERKGWTFRAQKDYVRGRFNNVRPVLNQVVFNHKVEQIARALTIDFSGDTFGALHSTSPVLASLHFGHEAQTIVKLGKLTNRGVTLFGDRNTALALLGLNGAAVLHELSCTRIVDDITGEKFDSIVNDGTYIYSPLGVIMAVADECAKDPKGVLARYMESRNAG